MSRDIRDACFETLYDIACKDPNVILLTDDMGAFTLEKFKKDLPKQYYNIGIAEQNMVSVAAGLALTGKKPFLYGISAFMSLRCLDQLKLDVCAMNLPVTIISTGPGLSYGSDGPTHHAVQDIAVLDTLPELSIYNPIDDISTMKIVQLAYEAKKPTYIRLEKGILPTIYSINHNFTIGFNELKQGRDTLIISTGAITHHILEIISGLKEAINHFGLLDMYCIKPIDISRLEAVLSRYLAIIVIEETTDVLGNKIRKLLTKGTTLKCLQLPDKHIWECGDREYLKSLYKLDNISISNFLANFLRGSSYDL